MMQALIIAFGVLLCSMDAWAEQDLVWRESDELWEALERRDIRTFDEVLDRGVLDTVAFERHEVHYILCEATRRENEPFLKSILAHGVSPDVQNLNVSALNRNALACAATHANVDAFDILLDAGAETESNLCTTCTSPRTLFTIFAYAPPITSRILDRRRLSHFEAQDLARQLEKNKWRTVHEGRPTYEWYQGILRGYGIDNVHPLGAIKR